MNDDHGFDWRARIRAILDGQITDRIPAILRLDKWYKARVHSNNLPADTFAR